jgi:dUTP pyrophosphatase
MVVLKVKRLHKQAKLPSKRIEDAGYDVYGCFEEEAVFLYPGDIYLVPLGIATEFSSDYVFFITERSGAGIKGISTRAGVIDSGYRGEIKTPLNNTAQQLIVFTDLSKEDLEKKYGNKLKGFEDNYIIYPQSKAIAQGMLLPCVHADVEEVYELGDSLRGEGGFGSSGK